MEGCLSPRNTFGVLRANSVAAESNTIEEISDLSSDGVIYTVF